MGIPRTDCVSEEELGQLSWAEQVDLAYPLEECWSERCLSEPHLGMEDHRRPEVRSGEEKLNLDSWYLPYGDPFALMKVRALEQERRSLQQLLQHQREELRALEGSHTTELRALERERGEERAEWERQRAEREEALLSVMMSISRQKLMEELRCQPATLVDAPRSSASKGELKALAKAEKKARKVERRSKKEKKAIKPKRWWHCCICTSAVDN
ncbi:zinc finger CCCH domain-containing protein 18-like [Sardina pilchardus]|uniref:zinc finger CCCH domain-containing protein 18-like n=1 Tax=Sardina pilchardus TaxID=27697 RepID=UPI002E12E1AC